MLFREQHCSEMSRGSSPGWAEMLCSTEPCKAGDRLLVTISSPGVSTALCSAQPGEPAKALAICLSGFLLVLKNPCGISRVPYFLEIFLFIRVTSFSANKYFLRYHKLTKTGGINQVTQA